MLIFAAILTCLMFTVIITDITSYIIPNWLVAGLLLLYPIMAYSLHVPDWQWALGIGLACFAVGFLIFIVNIMGGGDIKLLAVCALFAGKSAFPPFIMGVALLGGVLALALILLRPMAAFLGSRRKTMPVIPRVLTINEPVPYGVAIAIAFLLLLWSGKIPGITLIAL